MNRNRLWPFTDEEVGILHAFLSGHGWETVQKLGLNTHQTDPLVEEVRKEAARRGVSNPKAEILPPLPETVPAKGRPREKVRNSLLEILKEQS